jgi:hypothetical protein
MDLLKSLHLEELPEQQTRTSHLAEDHPEFDLNLGFDACCSCGKESPKVVCGSCRRILYCSKECREQDSNPPNDEEEQALGHTSVVCALLALCNDDEAVESGESKSVRDKDKRQGATDRVASEYESYPATLANAIMEGPCYQKTLRNCKRRNLTIHVVGASMDSELWEGHPDKEEERNVFRNYADALSEIADSYKLKGLFLHFVGPDCPKKSMEGSEPVSSINGGPSSCKLKYQTIRGEYNTKVLQDHQSESPDVVVFFNPGFTCPDYDWKEALLTIGSGVPCLITTNTELEGVADAQYLLDNNFVEELPAALLGIMGSGESEENVEDEIESFFSVNPYCGMRVRQSGTMANDLYGKNRWIFGGVFGSKDKNEYKAAARKKPKIEGSGNSKKKNPALV